MTLKERISEDMKAAMKAKETARLAAIRLLLAAIKQKEVDEQVTLDDAAIAAVIDKMLKQRKDSITQYEAAQRQDLADAEKAEVLQREKSLLYVAATRARDELVLLWAGDPSELLPATGPKSG